MIVSDMHVGSVVVCRRLMSCIFHLQVPMLGKGVVEASLITMAAVQSGGTEALEVQIAACSTLCNLSADANRVRLGGVVGWLDVMCLPLF